VSVAFTNPGMRLVRPGTDVWAKVLDSTGDMALVSLCRGEHYFRDVWLTLFDLDNFVVDTTPQAD